MLSWVGTAIEDDGLKGAYALINKATKSYCDSLFIIAERKSVHQALKDPALSLWKERFQASRLANKFDSDAFIWSNIATVLSHLNPLTTAFFFL